MKQVSCFLSCSFQLFSVASSPGLSHARSSQAQLSLLLLNREWNTATSTPYTASQFQCHQPAPYHPCVPIPNSQVRTSHSWAQPMKRLTLLRCLSSTKLLKSFGSIVTWHNHDCRVARLSVQQGTMSQRRGCPKETIRINLDIKTIAWYQSSGYSQTSGWWASPFVHCHPKRDVDSNSAKVMGGYHSHLPSKDTGILKKYLHSYVHLE